MKHDLFAVAIIPAKTSPVPAVAIPGFPEIFTVAELLLKVHMGICLTRITWWNFFILLSINLENSEIISFLLISHK